MAGTDFVFNIARGASQYFYDAVENNRALAAAGKFTTTANSAFIVVLLETAGLEADATLRDYDDLAALIAGTSNEPAGGTYVRKVLTDVELAALPAPDDVNDRLDLVIPSQTYTALSTTGNGAIGKVVVGFDPDTTTGTDSSIIPVWALSVTFTPDGNDVVLQVNVAGIYRSQ